MMSKFCAITVVSIGVAIGIAVPARASTLACTGGELTLERLQGNDCVARIPLPRERPGSPEDAATAARAASIPDAHDAWKFIETPSDPPDEKRLVRLVGPRFLPDQSQAIDLRAAGNMDFVNAALQRTIIYLGLAQQDSAAGAQIEEDAGAIQAARVSLELRMTSN